MFNLIINIDEIEEPFAIVLNEGHFIKEAVMSVQNIEGANFGLWQVYKEEEYMRSIIN